MIKQLYQRVGLVVVLLLMLVASFGMTAVTQAEDTDSYSLTITYGTGCETVELTIPGQEVQKMESGKAYLIPKTNARITIKVVLKSGYEIKEMVGLAGAYLLDNGTRTWTLAANDEVTLTCQPKEYDIEYLAAAEGFHTQPTTGSFPTTYTFGNEETKISTPVLAGYKFKYWILLSGRDAEESTGQILSPKEGEDFVTLSSTTLPNTDTETLYLKPKWEPISYEVYRYDYIYNPLAPDKKGNPLFSKIEDVTKWTAPMGSSIDGNMGGAKEYPGFHYPGTAEYYSAPTDVTVSVDGTPLNIVYRLYVPNEYLLEFISGYEDAIAFGEGVQKPEKHVFNVETVIPDPIRTGYVFTGWTVKVIKNGVESTMQTSAALTIEDMDAAYAGDKDTKLVLTANWKAAEYTITIDKNTGSEDDVSVYSEKYVFDKGLTVPDPTRAGYTFTGWLINGGTETATGKLDPFIYSADITMVAQWKANEYTVTFDGNGATVEGLDKQKVTFDTLLDTEALKAKLPVREGHLLMGFTLTRDGTDFVIDQNGKFLPTVWNIPADTTLYAKWDVIPYLVSVNAVNAKIWLNDVLYTGEAMSFNYGTTVTVKIEADAGFKVTAWEGKGVAHTHVFTTTYTIPAQNSELDATVLKMITTPAFSVDYVNEIFKPDSGIGNGTYQISCGSETLKIVVQGSTLYVNDAKVTEISIPESFFGKTVEIMMFGDGTTTADSDPMKIALAARPALPVLNNQVQNIYEDYRTIAIKMNPSAYQYEFAISLSNDGTGLNWVDASSLPTTNDGALAFELLNPGTIYYVYIRVKAADGDHPHGFVNTFEQKTYFVDYLNQKITELQNMVQEDDGEMVKKLIEDAIAEAKALEKPSATFYNDLEGIMTRVANDLGFAREQDAKIRALRALRDQLCATGEFTNEAVLELHALCTSAEDLITGSAKTTDEVRAAYDAGVLAMKAVKISYLIHGDMKLTSFAGLAQGNKLFQQRFENIASIVQAVDSAIKTGKISVASGNSMLLADAIEALRSLDVMAYYNMKLTYENATVTAFEGEFEIRLLLPEDLRGISGLQVAYYDEKTGVIEVLETERDGNALIFEANAISNFVILGDPTVNLTGLIASLGVILLCQLIGIILLLIRRSKRSKEVRSYASVLPVLLTIRFLPDSALTIVAVLGVLVILFQIILMYLLLTSDVFYRKHRKEAVRKEEPANEPEALPVMADAESSETLADEDTEEPYEAVADTDAACLSVFAENEEEPTDLEQDGYTEEICEEDLSEDETAEDELLCEDAEEEEDPYGFIEPAANPRYSLPEDDFAELDSEEESEEAADGELEENGATVVWAYDDGEDAIEEIDGDPEAEEAVAEEFYADDADSESEYTEGDLPEEDSEALSEEDSLGCAEADDAEDSAFEAQEVSDGEDSAEESEEPEDEFYIEPDARGDEAPAPDYSIYSEEDDELTSESEETDEESKQTNF